MANEVKRLTVRGISALGNGLHADGDGLYLNATGKGRRWVFIWRSGNRRREMGLGSVSSVSLASARDKASAARAIVAAGGDPIEARKSGRVAEAVEEATTPTFAEFADEFITAVQDGWRNATHRQQWRNSLRDHAGPLRDKPIDAITTDDMLAVLRPIWLTKSETASRVRGRIEKILDAAKAKGLRPKDSMNPATLRGHLALLLPKQSKLNRGHHAAMPFADAPAFWVKLRERPALAARCLQFTILTAARTGETLGATWGEIDLAAKVWNVPAERMKAGELHTVPLSTAALAILDSLRPETPAATDLIFAVGGAARSNMAMSMLLRRMGHGDVTCHGFRSTFRDWAGDTTEYPRDLIEQALAHTLESKVERAYRRGTAIERRRALMQTWADYLTGTASSANHPAPLAMAGA